MSISKKLQKLKELKSYSIPAKRLKEHLKPLLSKSKELEKRWMWELMQNATDLGEEISVKFSINKDRLVFSHNGKPFTLNEAYNLIMPDSGKDEEHEVNKKVIGQFGTGFISTHILSKCITISGIAHDEDDDEYYEFEFDLDRSERTDKEGLIESIVAAEDDFQRNLAKIEEYEYSQTFETKFKYDLTDNYDGIDGESVVEKGLDYFFNLIPYVFCFRPELFNVKLFDRRNTKEVWDIEKEHIATNIKDLQLVKIIALKNKAKEWEVIIGSIDNGETTIAFELKHLRGNRFEVQAFPENCSKLFCAFPMIGTEDFNFPVIINSQEFVPNRERDGIELSKYDEENRERIIEARDAYVRLLEIIEKHNWTKAFNVCSVSNQEFKDLDTNRWYNRTIKNTLKSEIRKRELIDSVDLEGNRIRTSLENCYIPYTDSRVKNSDEILTSIFDLASYIIPERLPNKDDYRGWNSAIDFELFGNEKLSIEVLLDVVSGEAVNLSDFKKEYQKGENLALNWINNLITFLLQQENIELLDDYALVPSQTNDLAKLSKLKNDFIAHKSLPENYEEKVKDIFLDISGMDFRSKLIHHGIENKEHLIEEEERVTLKDFSLEVDKEFREYEGERQDATFLNSLKKMLNWYTNCGLSDETLSEYFPWFSKNKSQLYMDTQTSIQREQTFDILLSGKTEALAKIANSNVSVEELNTIANNSALVTSFLGWLGQKEKDNPNEELGDIGEEFVYYKLCEIFGKERVEWINEDAYDFLVLNKDKSVKYFIDAKTTNKGIGNSDKVPFFMRYSQWNFLPNEEVKGKYIIARVFREGEKFNVRFLNIMPETLK